jgi:hypothetical protein
VIERTKDERRRQAWAFKGNAQVVEVKLGYLSLELLKHPNRVQEQYRSSNRTRRVA